MDRLDLSVDRAKVEHHLEQELRAVRGLSRAERESLLRNGMRENLRYRLRTLMRLPAFLYARVVDGQIGAGLLSAEPTR